MRGIRFVLEKALHLRGELGHRILVSESEVPKIRRFGHLVIYATASLLAITIILFRGHMFIDVFYVISGRDGKIVRRNWER